MDINEILKTEESRKNFLIGLIFLSRVDGVDESEKVFFANAAAGLNLSEEAQNEVNLSWTKEEMPEVKFEDKKASLFFIMQAIQLSNVDNSYTERERAYIYNTATKLGLSNESVEKIELWVEEGLRWQAEGVKLLDLEV